MQVLAGGIGEGAVEGSGASYYGGGQDYRRGVTETKVLLLCRAPLLSHLHATRRRGQMKNQIGLWHLFLFINFFYVLFMHSSRMRHCARAGGGGGIFFHYSSTVVHLQKNK